MKPYSLALGLAFALFICNGAEIAFSQSIAPALPTTTELKAISYQQIAQPNLASVPPYQDVHNTIRGAESYSRGSQLLPAYRDPILTRGTTGISVFRNVSPGVVLIVVYEEKSGQSSPSGLGAGVILDSVGDVLTNWHVINGSTGGLAFLKPLGSTDIQSGTGYSLQIIGQDEVSDLALLRLVKPPADLHPVAMGSMATIQVAEDIHVIGHPHGNLWSYSTGVVSQIRDNYEWTYEDGSKHKAKVLQLQTAINPGNSGGPVVDDQGRLLGLVAMGEEGQNLDYAIAADAVQSFVSSALSTRTRGGGTEGNIRKAEYSSGRLRDGRSVLRAVYPDLNEYLVMDLTGKTVALAADTTDGVNVLAWEPNSFGGFNEWAITLPNKNVVHARGSGAIPDQFSSK